MSLRLRFSVILAKEIGLGCFLSVDADVWHFRIAGWLRSDMAWLVQIYHLLSVRQRRSRDYIEQNFGRQNTRPAHVRMLRGEACSLDVRDRGRSVLRLARCQEIHWAAPQEKAFGRSSFPKRRTLKHGQTAASSCLMQCVSRHSLTATWRGVCAGYSHVYPDNTPL